MTIAEKLISNLQYAIKEYGNDINIKFAIKGDINEPFNNTLLDCGIYKDGTVFLLNYKSKEETN